MHIRLLGSLRHYHISDLPKDLLSGLIIAAVSIPISMGYAQISGLPAVYGLYGSVFPILVFALFTTSPQMIFGVDAAPAAIVGSVIASLGIVAGSAEAQAVIPLIAFFAACWLLLFAFLKAGRLVNYVSAPVMGGFISGICTLVILMQIPKLMGSDAGTGELFSLMRHIIEACGSLNWLGFLMGLGSLAILEVSKRLIPRIPMAIVILVAGALATAFFHVDQYGVVLLSAVEPGFPTFTFPDFSVVRVTEGIGTSLSVALVIMAESLLAENNFALRNDYKVDDNQELLAFSLGNFAAAFTGCCPTNGSVSRTTMSEQSGGRTQLVSLVACGLMVLVLLFCTPLISYLPVPVLVSIVISALISATEFDLAKRLWQVCRKEFFIFAAAFFGVLILGSIYGVIIGVLLSFFALLRQAVDPTRAFLGMVPGESELLDLKREPEAQPVQNVIIYRFNESLFFANISVFQKDIEDALKPDTFAVIVDASGIGHIDITAADRLILLNDKLKDQGVAFYMTEHMGIVNDQLRLYDAGHLIDEGVVRQTVWAALRDIAADNETMLSVPEMSLLLREDDKTLSEFSWAFGEDFERHIDKLVKRFLSHVDDEEHLDFESALDAWHGLSISDESDLLERLLPHIQELANRLQIPAQTVEMKIENRLGDIAEHLQKMDPDTLKQLRQQHLRFEKRLGETEPALYQSILARRKEAFEQLERDDPERARRLRDWFMSRTAGMGARDADAVGVEAVGVPVCPVATTDTTIVADTTAATATTDTAVVAAAATAAATTDMPDALAPMDASTASDASGDAQGTGRKNI